MTDLHAYARGAAVRAGIDPDLFERQIGQESGFNPDAYNASSGATGIAQIIARFHPNVDPRDPLASLDYAAHWIASLRASYGSYKHALAAYNWGPGNVNRWNGQRATLPAETRRYLDVIMGPGWPEPGGGTPVAESMKLSEILARARSRIGDPYVWGGKAPPSTDCSGFVAWCYDGKVTSFTDAILGETERVATPAPGDIVLWEYSDPEQPGVRFPHVGLFLSDAESLDNRYGSGVGIHPQIPRSKAARYYRRLPGVIVDTLDAPADPTPPVVAPPGPDPRDARIAQLEQEKAGLLTVIGYLTGDVADALQAAVNTMRAQKAA